MTSTDTRFDPPPPAPQRRLTRSRTDRMVAGVCGGLAEYSGVDVTIIRLLVVAMAVFGGAGIVLYVAAWLLVPEASP